MTIKEKLKKDFCANCKCGENPKDLKIDCNALVIGEKQGGCILGQFKYYIKRN
ncbi:hypothetical protein P5F02_15215 [Clostridium perfringens]|uniref:hypothetical protein n=1 Tax=Clostridium perfringens TaxID=1502 RepID=UPI0018E44D49|nr:hypothetical protein [Clostridium perfringens]MBI6094505.1 hypothetical protein [Clostridium perfringens]MDK0578318.1 hypothetical protein [Clostridium perfringens]MDK0581232.1 hypothetical protein [Clostridium perfringens]MDM0456042.1 hypothetical protein [Clostridium perfringens]